jgi:RNase P/RNase MRP subunit POP5
LPSTTGTGELTFEGTVGAAVRYYDEATQVFILRCKRDAYRSAWAAMTLLSAVGQARASISVWHVAGEGRTA